MYIVLIIVIVLLIVVLIQYNSLINLRNKVKQAKSGIDIFLNQRFDLIPNLVECVKGYSKHEKEIFENISQLRAEYVKSKDLKQAEKLNNGINEIMALAENYPDLKASEQYLNLQKNLSKIESELQAARRIYNIEVTNYNTAISVVPKNIVANMFGFKEEELFEIEDNKRENIKVNFEE